MLRFLDLSRRRRALSDGGFTLIEIIAAIGLLAIAATAAVPLLISGMKASATARMNTQAKNLAQQRFESMRDLQFHVDRQNGPFVDLLDIYYTNATTPAVVTTVSRAFGANSNGTPQQETEQGSFVASGTSPDPTGPLYRVSVASVPGYPSFSQIIDTQFLNADGSVMPASKFTGYDNLTVGKDTPPSLLVGITVITTWTDHGKSHSYKTYTRIADSRGTVSAITSQGIAEFLRVASAGSSGNSLTVDLARSEANGNQSTASTASADVRALQATDSFASTLLGASGTANSPTGGSTGSAQTNPVNGGAGCSWIGAGQTQVNNVTGSVANGGLPQVPATVDSASPPVNEALASLMAGGNSACNASFAFSNQSNSYASNLGLDADAPLVRIPNVSGTSAIATASSWVNATDATTDPHSVTSGANIASSQQVQIFPGATRPDSPGTTFITDGKGLVDVTLSSATIACSATVDANGVTQAATASYTVTVDYWKSTDSLGDGTRVTLPAYTWSTGTTTSDPLAAVDLSTPVYQNGSTVLRLSDFISSWSTARQLSETPNNGLHQLNNIVAIASQPVRSGDPTSTVSLQLGSLSCTADDNR